MCQVNFCDSLKNVFNVEKPFMFFYHYVMLPLCIWSTKYRVDAIVLHSQSTLLELLNASTVMLSDQSVVQTQVKSFG